MSRPEHEAPPEIYYDDVEAKKYTTSSRVVEIQAEMTNRALELLNLPDRSCFILDIGCGSGLSGEEITENNHNWVGIDISRSMLNVAREREVEGDLLEGDIGQGLPFRHALFDGAISISCIQWLCNADKASHKPTARLLKFFQSLYTCLNRGARAIFQFYPENPQQVELITNCAMRSGFTGGLVIDYPNSTKKKKYFLCLFAGSVPGQINTVPQGQDENTQTVNYVGSREKDQNRRGKGKRKSVKDRDWVLKKKELYRKRGKDVPTDSKYTARKRGPKF